VRFLVKILKVERRFVDCDTSLEALAFARSWVMRLGDDAKLLAIYAGDEPSKPADPPVGKPPSSPTPGTPTIDRYECLTPPVERKVA
jgi:hypothetical protein